MHVTVFSIGDWRKKSTIGKGTHGVVLLYVNDKNKENIAIKQFNSEFGAEVSILQWLDALLESPAIV